MGIFARRVSIMPFSPYDFDNHVVTEIYDRKLGRWIMLDPTTDGYFVDESGAPLSLLQMREKFAKDEFVTFVRATDRLKDLPRLREKYVYYSSYICKNLFYFMVGTQCRFGPPEDYLTVCPAGYSIRSNLIANTRYRVNHLPGEYAEFIESAKQRLQQLEQSPERALTDVSVLLAAPV